MLKENTLARATVAELIQAERNLNNELEVIHIRQKDTNARLLKIDSSSSRWGDLIKKHQAAENREDEILSDLIIIYKEMERRYNAEIPTHGEGSSSDPNGGGSDSAT